MPAPTAMPTVKPSPPTTTTTTLPPTPSPTNQNLSKWNTNKAVTCEDFAVGSACLPEEEDPHDGKKTCGAPLTNCDPGPSYRYEDDNVY